MIFFLAVISLNGPDYTTYRKNFYTFSGNLDSVKFFDYFFSILIISFIGFDLNVFIFQTFVKFFFFFGFYVFIKNMFEKKFDYIFIIIFASVYFIPVASLTNLYQMAAIGLFLILISFREFKLVRDLPILLIILLMHKSAIGIVFIYSLNYILKFKRIKFVKNILNLIFFNIIPFTIFIYFKADTIKKFLANYINTVELEISNFSLIWFVLYAVLILNFLISRNNFKKYLNSKDYNFLISSSCYFIFVLNMFFISEVYALRFLYYAFPFFLYSFGLISKINWLNFSNFKNYYRAAYISAAFLFVGLWYGTANHKWSFENYKFLGKLEFFCNDYQKCKAIYNSDPNVYRIIRKHLKLEEYSELGSKPQKKEKLGPLDKFKRDTLLNN